MVQPIPADISWSYMELVYLVTNIIRAKNGMLAMTVATNGCSHAKLRHLLTYSMMPNFLLSYGFVPTAQWKGVDMKKVPSASAWAAALRHSAASSAVRVGRMPP